MIASNRPLAVIWLAAALAAGCGSDDDSDGGSAVEKADVEQALKAELAAGGGGIVQHEQDPPRQITCTREAGSRTGWRCTVTPSKGSETYVCFVELEPQTRKLTKTTCARVDN